MTEFIVYKITFCKHTSRFWSQTLESKWEIRNVLCIFAMYDVKFGILRQSLKSLLLKFQPWRFSYQISLSYMDTQNGFLYMYTCTCNLQNILVYRNVWFLYCKKIKNKKKIIRLQLGVIVVSLIHITDPLWMLYDKWWYNSSNIGPISRV